MSGLPLSVRLPQATRELHRKAERAGVMRTLLEGRLERARYVRLLASLHTIYEALEGALDADRVRAVAPMPALRRTEALARDLADYGTDPHRAPPEAVAVDYAARVAHLAREQPALVAAHAYVRYLGDLSGGQILKDIVARAVAPAPGRGTAFYAFGGAAELDRARTSIREALDAMPSAHHDAVVAEARDAFARHIQLFEALA
ncbi:MAG: biliverdin-producing heme oxygenase [Burkholderiales bacterium]